MQLPLEIEIINTIYSMFKKGYVCTPSTDNDWLILDFKKGSTSQRIGVQVKKDLKVVLKTVTGQIKNLNEKTS